MRNARKKEPCQKLRDYFRDTKYAAGKSSKTISEKLGITTVSMCNLAGRLDEMSVSDLEIIATEVNVKPLEFIETVLTLSKKCK